MRNTGDRGGTVWSVAVASTGQIALLYQTSTTSAGGSGAPLWLAFLDPAADGGSASPDAAAGLTVQRVVQVESGASLQAGAQVVWTNNSNSFVVSWADYNASVGTMSALKYGVDGAAKSGGATAVPTDRSGGHGNASRPTVGESGNLLGVSFISGNSSTSNYPALTALDLVGSQVGTSVYFSSTPPGSKEQLAVAGTSQGFVGAMTQGSSTVVVLVPTSSAGIVADGGTFPRFSLSGGAANSILAVSDDIGTGGLGGVGLALLYSTGLSFTYVNSAGTSAVGPVSVFPAGGSSYSITNYNGSFVLAFYDPSKHSAQIAASGCP